MQIKQIKSLGFIALFANPIWMSSRCFFFQDLISSSALLLWMNKYQRPIMEIHFYFHKKKNSHLNVKRRNKKFWGCVKSFVCCMTTAVSARVTKHPKKPHFSRFLCFRVFEGAMVFCVCCRLNHSVNWIKSKSPGHGFWFESVFFLAKRFEEFEEKVKEIFAVSLYTCRWLSTPLSGSL